jgi:nucleotide-binding universal stress UspA family protein
VVSIVGSLTRVDRILRGGTSMKLLRMQVVLAAVDYDDASHAVLDAARALAEASGADLHAVHVDAPTSETRGATRPSERSSADAAMALLERANVPIDRSRCHVIAGEPAPVMRDLAERIGADVIVLGPHREQSGARGHLGGTALMIAAASSAPCLIVRRPLHLPLRRVLVPVDLSDTARGALVVALSWSSALRGAPGSAAAHHPAELTAMFVDRAEGAGAATASARHALEAELDRVRKDAGSWAGVSIHGVTVAGADAAGAIADRARDEHADLVVLGTRGLGLDGAGRLGSVSAEVSRRMDVPVLLVPPAIWTKLGSAP